MRTVLFAIGFLIAASSQASAKPLRDAIDDLEDALDYARDEGGRCKRRVAPAIKDLRRDLRKADTKRDIRRALDDLRDVRDDAEDCGRKVNKRLRSAKRSLRDAMDDFKGGKAAPPKKKAVVVPQPSWSKDCKTTWFMYRLARLEGSKKNTMDKINSMVGVACAKGARLGEMRWPNGKIARYQNGDWYYPNGKIAAYANGDRYFIRGKVAKYANGDWYYPNGKIAKYANGDWYYPNGRRAGGWQAVKAWACGRSKDKCKFYDSQMNSKVVAWRNMTLMEESYRAR